MPKLVTTSDGPLKGLKHDIGPSGLTVGRSSENMLCVDDQAVSGRHCRFDLQGSRCVVTDLNSTNGTFVNGQRISKVALAPGDIIAVGPLNLYLEADSPVEEEAGAVGATPQKTAHPYLFGTQRDSRIVWLAVTSVMALLAIAALVFFVMRFVQE